MFLNLKCNNKVFKHHQIYRYYWKSLTCKISFSFPSKWSNFLPISSQTSFPFTFPSKCQNILLEGNFLPSGSSAHQCSFVHSQVHDDSYITTCECSHQTHVGQHGDIINATKHPQSFIGRALKRPRGQWALQYIYCDFQLSVELQMFVR